jgi:ribosomal protein L11 methyltransferase
MQYIQVIIPAADAAIREQLVAQLAELQFEAFEETDDILLAYIQEELLDIKAFGEIVAVYNLGYEAKPIQQENWNAQWEESFQPVIVPGFCTVRASFHTIATNTPYEVVITPKMSFGTGHHATTQLMMEQMQQLDFNGKSVFDFGTGTGILAILAEKLGATEVFAVDNDEWSYENAIENTQQNNNQNVKIVQGSIDRVGEKQFDIILANINRHILLEYMNEMYSSLHDNGKILMSGLLKEDFDIINEAATQSQFKFLEKKELNNWIVLLYAK